MRKKSFWITASLVNLCILAFLGTILRTKLVLPLPFVNYKNVLNAHSHFAFGGWVTLALMVLFIDQLLTNEQQQKNAYQVSLWGIQITSFGMLITFPFTGYALLSIVFSTLFIFTTYYFVWTFIKDVRKSQLSKPVFLLAVAALACLAVSSVGPYTLAYIMATKAGDIKIYKDAVYTYLHFQYNGFFTCAVFALLFNKMRTAERRLQSSIRSFGYVLVASVIPTLFISYLWHSRNDYVEAVAFFGCGLMLVAVILLSRLAMPVKRMLASKLLLVNILLFLSIGSFIIKMLLQTMIVIPTIRDAVFGYRPVIIGFLHLIFLMCVTFYILADFVEQGVLSLRMKLSSVAVIVFVAAVLLTEGVLLVKGIGLLLSTTHYIYDWLLWIGALGLFAGSVLIIIARLSRPSLLPNP